ncbi:MAG: stage II sporulation protein M [Anaerolinea sp.]|nr:stage II sporulation protein M [Anaerolinea sp.]
MMREQMRPVWVIALREVRDQFRDWRIIFPIAALTVFFPFLMTFTAQRILRFVEQYGANVVAERLVPFLLLIVGFFPTSFSLVIALETFVGEKERGSIEPLLNSPLKDWQIYFGKLISSTVPPLFGSFLGMSVYLGGLTGRVPLPEFEVLALVVVLTIVQAVVMVSGAVVVSTQATSVRAANLLASFIILPVALLIQGESVVMFWGDYRVLWLAAAGMVLLAGLLVRVGVAHFQREELLGRDLDVLNLRWMGRVFWAQFTRGARTPWQWYRLVIGDTLQKMRPAIFFAVVLAVLSIVVGTQLVRDFFIPLDANNLAEVEQRLGMVSANWEALTFRLVLLIFWQNVRVMLLTLVLGVLSLGILGVLPMFASLALAGYLMATLGANGLPAWQYTVALLLPHGLIEIPAVILATAAVLRGGALLATPTPGKAVGQVMIEALADWAAVFVGLVLPMLLLAAVVEVGITPRVAMLILQ